MKMTLKMALAVTTLSILLPWRLLGTQAADTTKEPPATALERLQGSWEGVLVGHEKEGKISITITGNALHFQGLKPSEWYKTIFTLPVGTYPQQLHATIKDSPEPDDIGVEVFAIFKIEDGTLTLAGIQGSDIKKPDVFGLDQRFEDNPMFRYDLKKVQPQATQPPQSK
jgi:hypothetical protein